MEQREVDPALLSVVCDELNRRRIELSQSSITADLLNVEREEIIRKFYERSFEDVDPRVRDWVEDELLTANGYRNRAALEDALKLGLPAVAFDQLVNRRVLHREERSGVIWLELTHDLLTDPASQSRTARDQRRQAEEAARREAEIKRKLRGTRMVAAGFAVILLGALGALGYALYMGKKAQVAQATAEEAQKKATTEAANAVASLHTAVQTAEEQSSRIAEWFRAELMHPTPGILKTVAGSLDILKTDTKQFSTSGIIEPNYAETLALSAEILANHGLFSESLGHAEASLAIAARLEKKADSDQLRFARAEASYSKAICLLEAGHLNAARAEFKEGVRLADLVQPSSFKSSAARIKILSTIGLGDVAIRSFSLAEAQDQFNQALRLAMLNESKAPNDEVKSMLIQAHRGLGEMKSQTEDALALTHFKDASKVVEPLVAGSPDNLRWQEFDAEISYLQGMTELNLGHLAEASQLLNKALSMNSIRSSRDPDNLKWRYLLGRSYRGVGLLQKAYGNVTQAHASFQQLKDISTEVKKKQPSWIQASYLEAVSLYHLGVMADTEYLDPYTQTEEMKKSRAESLTQFKASQSAFEALVKTSPEVPEFNFALVTLFKDQGVLFLPNHKPGEAGDAKIAHDFFNKASLALGKLKGAESRSWRVLDLEARHFQAVGDLYFAEKKYSNAAVSYQQAVKIVTTSMTMVADPYRDLELLSELESSLGDSLWDPKNPSISASHFNMADNYIELALQRPPHQKDTSLLSQKAKNLIEIASMWDARNDFAQSIKTLRSAIDVSREAFRYEPYNVSLLKVIGNIHTLAVQFYNAAVLPARPTDPKPQIAPALLQSANELLDLSDPDKILLPEPEKRLTHNVLAVNKPQNWILPPIMAGAWHTLVPTEQELETQILSGADPRIKADRVLHIRSRRLNFYKDMVLYEAEISLSSGGRGVVSYLRYGTSTTILDGQPSTIYRVNKSSPPILDTVDQATGYLRFFIGAYADTFDGRLVIIDRTEDLNWLPNATETQRSSVQRMIRPLMVQENPDHSWGAVGTSQYLDGLYYMIFRVSRDGDLELNKNTSVASDLPIVTEDFSDNTRVLFPKEAQLEKARAVLKTDPNNMIARGRIPSICFDLKHYKDAVAAEKSLIDVLLFKERQTPAEESTHAIRNAYVSLAWYQLFNRDFAGALSASEEGLKLDPGFLPTDTNRAHALLFLGRTEEAEKVYKQHLGETETSSGRKWEQVILADFADLENAGVTNTEFARIRKYLEPQSK
jgi:tetratricopeptide (TPR) repeat protein